MSDTEEEHAIRANGQMRPMHVFQFYFLFPVGLGLFLGAGAIGPHQFVTIGHHIAYAISTLTLAWACYGLGSKLAGAVLRPWHPALWLVLLVGFGVGGTFLWSPLRELLIVGFEPYLQPGSVFRPFWPPPRDNLATWIVMTVQSGAGWLVFNWLDFRFRRVPRFGFVPPAVEPTRPASGALDDSDENAAASIDTPPSPPRLLDRLPDELRDGHIYALEAQEHYTKIYTSKGNTLVLIRFSDAIVDMEPQPGLRVHRSYWVSRDSVEHISPVGKRLMLHVQGGLQVPVSRTYRVSVMNAGFDSRDKSGVGAKS